MRPSVQRVSFLASRLELHAVRCQSHMQQRFILSVAQSNEGAAAWQCGVSAHVGLRSRRSGLEFVSSWAGLRWGSAVLPALKAGNTSLQMSGSAIADSYACRMTGCLLVCLVALCILHTGCYV